MLKSFLLLDICICCRLLRVSLRATALTAFGLAFLINSTTLIMEAFRATLLLGCCIALTRNAILWDGALVAALVTADRVTRAVRIATAFATNKTLGSTLPLCGCVTLSCGSGGRGGRRRRRRRRATVRWS